MDIKGFVEERVERSSAHVDSYLHRLAMSEYSIGSSPVERIAVNALKLRALGWQTLSTVMALPENRQSYEEK